MAKYIRYDWKNHEEKYGTALYDSCIELVKKTKEYIDPESVIDVGCGNGTLLKVFKEQGSGKILGIDGPWVNQSSLLIDEEEFLVHDLIGPIQFRGKYDLVISIEVAEHLPREKAESFIELLTNLGPVILFASAIPFQGGNKHINEQWPDYWQQLFNKHHYLLVDCFRKQLWDNENIKWWVAQNTFLYIDDHEIEYHPKIKFEYEQGLNMPCRCVHPKNYMQKADRKPRQMAKHLFKTIKNRIENRAIKFLNFKKKCKD